MKQLQKFRVKRAFGTRRVGDIITPTGMHRDELKACGWIEPYVDPEPEPVSVPVVAVETADEPEPETAAIIVPQRRRGRPRHGR